MDGWHRNRSHERHTWLPPRNSGEDIPPFGLTEPRVPPPGATSFLTSYLDHGLTPPPPPPLPRPPNYPHGHPPYGPAFGPPVGPPFGPSSRPPFGPAYGPANGPAHVPPRPSTSRPGFALTPDGVYVPVYHDRATFPPPRLHHHHHHHHHPHPSYFPTEPPTQPHPGCAPYGAPPLPPFPQPPYSRPQSCQIPPPPFHLPRWPEHIVPTGARMNPRWTPLPVDQTPISLHDRPEQFNFHSEAELRARLTPVFRPMVGVVGRQVQEQLSLAEQPRVKFDLYPVQVDERGQSPRIRWRTLSRAPVYCVTLPRFGTSESRLQEVGDAVKDTLANCANPWYRQAGLVFRISRSAPLAVGQTRSRFWIPPMCVYKFSRSLEVYRAMYIEVLEEAVAQVDDFHDYGDTSEDDQEALVDEMWEDVRRRRAYGPWAPNPSLVG